MTAAIIDIRYPTAGGHPSWCACPDDTDPRHAHHAAAVQVPATAGPFRVADDGIVFARVDVSATVGRHTRGVFVETFDPGDRAADRPRFARATLSPDEARRLAQALIAHAELAEAGEV